MITDSDYVSIQHQNITIASLLLEIDYDGFIERIDRCDAVAPLLAPELYRENSDKMIQTRKLAVMLNDVKKKIIKMQGAE